MKDTAWFAMGKGENTWRRTARPAPDRRAPQRTAASAALVFVLFELPARERRQGDRVGALRAERRLLVADLVAARPDVQPVPCGLALDERAACVARRLLGCGGPGRERLAQRLTARRPGRDRRLVA